MSNLIDMATARLDDFDGVFNPKVFSLEDFQSNFLNNKAYCESLMLRSIAYKYLTGCLYLNDRRAQNVGIPRMYFRFTDNNGRAFNDYLTSSFKPGSEFKPLITRANYNIIMSKGGLDTSRKPFDFILEGAEKTLMEFQVALCGFIVFRDTDDFGIEKHFIRYYDKPIYTSFSTRDLTSLYESVGDERHMLNRFYGDTPFIGYRGIINRAFTKLYDILSSQMEAARPKKRQNTPYIQIPSQAANRHHILVVKQQPIITAGLVGKPLKEEKVVTTEEVVYEDIPLEF